MFHYMSELLQDALALYQQCISNSVVDYLQKQARLKVRRSIYTAQVVIWLMIVQRLQPRGTLATGVEALLAGAADLLLSDCERTRQKRILATIPEMKHQTTSANRHTTHRSRRRGSTVDDREAD